MKRTKKLRFLVLSMAMMLAIMPLSATAQGGVMQRGKEPANKDNAGSSMFLRDGQISGNISNQGFGGAETGITNQTFGETPMGSGLFILLAAGAGYAAMKGKKKRNKKSNS